MLVKNVFDDLAIGFQASSHNANLMKLQFAVLGKSQDLFRCRGDFIVNAERTDDLALPGFWKVTVFSLFGVIEEPC